MTEQEFKAQAAAHSIKVLAVKVMYKDFLYLVTFAKYIDKHHRNHTNPKTQKMQGDFKNILEQFRTIKNE